MYESLDIFQQFDCKDPSTSAELCEILTNTLKAVKNPQQKPNKSKKFQKTIDKNEIKANLASKIEGGAFKEPIKNYKLEPLIELLQVGFCDLKAEKEPIIL